MAAALQISINRTFVSSYRPMLMIMRRVLVCLLLGLASTVLAQSRGGQRAQYRPGTRNPDEHIVSWKFLPKGADLVKGPVVVYWLPATLAEVEHSPLRNSEMLLEATERCVGLEIVAPDDPVTIEKLGATGKLPMAVIINNDGRVVRQVNNARGVLKPQSVEGMLNAELNARDDEVLHELAEAKRTKSIDLYKKIWDDRCLYPLVGAEAQRALRDLGVIVKEPPSTLAPDPNLKVTPTTTTRH